MFYRFHLALLYHRVCEFHLILPHSVFFVCVYVFKETDLTDEDAAFSEVTLQFITVLLIHFYSFSKASKVHCSGSIFTQLNQYLHHSSKVWVDMIFWK